ncbi:MAG: biotin--[acetyl-CoA-carboxylase] ligase [Phycisphaerae bacterium]|nr:biotin--[acetyl-CoA-carboxylase] ligase [Phycisphaerae bacterium]
MSPERLQLEQITEGLATRRVGRRIEIHNTVDSTNRLAWQRVSEGECDGLAVFAEHQTAGCGRLGRRWESPRGASVMMSLVLHDPAGSLGGDVLSLLSAVSAVDAVDAATGVTAEIRWPNDLVADGRKLGGILIESRLGKRGETNSGENHRPEVYVVGIGINCLQHRNHFPAELRSSATSLDLECPHQVSRTEVARNLLRELDGWLANPERWDAADLKNAWVRRALALGQWIRLRQDGEEFCGQVLDVDPAGGLVVQLDRGGRRFFDASSTSVVNHA